MKNEIVFKCILGMVAIVGMVAATVNLNSRIEEARAHNSDGRVYLVSCVDAEGNILKSAFTDEVRIAPDGKIHIVEKETGNRMSLDYNTATVEEVTDEYKENVRSVKVYTEK